MNKPETKKNRKILLLLFAVVIGLSSLVYTNILVKRLQIEEKQKIETNVVKPEISFIENEIANIILNLQEETALDDKIKEIENFMVSNSGKGKTEEEKEITDQN